MYETKILPYHNAVEALETAKEKVITTCAFLGELKVHEDYFVDKMNLDELTTFGGDLLGQQKTHLDQKTLTSRYGPDTNKIHNAKVALETRFQSLRYALDAIKKQSDLIDVASLDLKENWSEYQQSLVEKFDETSDGVVYETDLLHLIPSISVFFEDQVCQF